MAKRKISASVTVALYAACLFTSLPAWAVEGKGTVVDIIPAHSATGDSQSTPFADSEATHPVLKVTPDKSELITLDRDAASVIVGNPIHANVIADSTRTLVVVPRSPGATYFTVLDKDGQVIMQRHVIVASPKEGYVRVKKVCNDDVKNCKDTNVFYCPDMCHQIGSAAESDDSGSSKSDSGADAAEKMSNASSGGDSDSSSEEGTTEE